MILLFPDLHTLQLALTSGAVPASVSLAPTAAALDDQGQVWLQPSVAPSRSALAELRRLKVQTPRTSAVPLTEQYHCWLQVFPVQPTGDRTLPPEHAPVLFDLPAGQFGTVATEILRLGNDRQSFRHLEGKDGERVLLRVIGPPYYTLLRALDREGAEAAPVAYLEWAPRVWVQVGHEHPFARQIKAPAGKLLLLRPPRDWTFMPDGPFRELYQVLEFVLPHGRSAWSEGPVDHKLNVPLRLAPGDPAEADELWVLRERPLEQLDELVGNAGEDLLQKLAFAVADKDGRTVIVLRVRPSREAPPALVLDAARFRTYLKLPNLFVPSGNRLHPPLGRHVVRKLLAEDPAVITWLYPLDDGTFTPETLPDEAFRPLTDWVDYVLDHDREALQAWVQAAQFEFEPFVCDEAAPKPKKPPAPGREKKGGRPQAAPAGGEDLQVFTTPVEQKADPQVAKEAAEPPRAEPKVLRQRLRTVEDQFLALKGRLDATERLALWPVMARLNAALGHGEDAGICWLNALWTEPAIATAWAWEWFLAEAARVPGSRNGDGSPGLSWVSSPAGGRNPQEPARVDLDRLLDINEPLAGDVRALAAYVYWAAGQSVPPAALLRRLGRVRQFLGAHERLLPLRAVWLAWVGLTRLSQGDVLGLARARDRLLERLLQNGPRPEQDLAGFLRFEGHPGGERPRLFRDWMRALCDLARRWVRNESAAATEQYADLILAFGLARLGEAEAARTLVDPAEAILLPKGDVHAALLRGFRFRIQHALESKPHTGPLPEELLQHISQLGRSEQSVVDRMRQHSRILEPDQRIDPYRRVTARDDLDQTLIELADLTDRRAIAERAAELLQRTSGGRLANQVHVLRAVLEVAPRGGEDLAVSVLHQASQTLDHLPPPTGEAELIDQAALVEKGLFVAAHFGRLDHVEGLVKRFRRLLESQRRAGNIYGLDSLAGQCFRGLRKFGMGEEMEALLSLLVETVLQGLRVASLSDFLEALPGVLARPNQHERSADKRHWLAALRAFVHVVGGWYYFGREGEAGRVLETAREVLFGGILLDPKIVLAPQQTLLACTYVASLIQAPAEMAKMRLGELFEQLRVHDMWVTSPYFKLSQLDVLDAVILAVVSDDFILGSNVRRWLDEDEFLVRSRIHRDVRETLARAR
jgi:hypothetical protein